MCLQTFWQWLSRFRLLEAAYFTFDPRAYNDLFDSELEKVIARTSDPTHRQALEHLRGFDWLSYIVCWVRHAGYRDQRERDEKAHEVVVKLLTGKLFTGYDPRIHGPMELRFRTSVANAVRNMTQKERNRRRLLPTTSITQEFVPGSVTAEELPAPAAREDDSKVVENFRELVRRRLGGLGLAVLDMRLEGGETKSLVGSPFAGVSGEVDDQEGRSAGQGAGEGVRLGDRRSRPAPGDREGDGGGIGDGREATGDDSGEAGGGAR